MLQLFFAVLAAIRFFCYISYVDFCCIKNSCNFYFSFCKMGITV